MKTLPYKSHLIAFATALVSSYSVNNALAADIPAGCDAACAASLGLSSGYDYISSSAGHDEILSSSYDSHGTEKKILNDQATKQVARQISNTISNRITSNIDANFSALSNAGGAGDGSILKPDSIWSTFSWSRLDNDGSTSPFETDIYQTTSGVDKKIGNFYIGTSLAYAATLSKLGGGLQHDDKHSVSIVPYVAYVFNKNFFVSALSGYLYTHSDPTFAQQSDTHGNLSEINLNALHVIDNWFMKGKVGGRYQYGYTRTDSVGNVAATTDNTDSWTFLTEASGGYAFQNGIKVFTGVLYELSNRQNGLTLPTGLKTFAGENSVFYYNAGVDYSITKAFTLGASVQTDLSNPTVDLTTVAINARLAL